MAILALEVTTDDRRAVPIHLLLEAIVETLADQVEGCYSIHVTDDIVIDVDVDCLQALDVESTRAAGFVVTPGEL